jgi:pseudoazurin
MRRRTLLVATAALGALPALPASAAEFEVQMLNRGEAGAMVFEPLLTKIGVGDTVRFVPTNPGHNAESIADILPQGAEPFKGAIGKEIAVTFDLPGDYGIKCLPHFAMGMVALVVVGDPPYVNVEAARAAKVPPNARKRLDAAVAELEAQPLSTS